MATNPAPEATRSVPGVEPSSLASSADDGKWDATDHNHVKTVVAFQELVCIFLTQTGPRSQQTVSLARSVTKARAHLLRLQMLNHGNIPIRKRRWWWAALRASPIYLSYTTDLVRAYILVGWPSMKSSVACLGLKLRSKWVSLLI